jgi:hypothetical protein
VPIKGPQSQVFSINHAHIVKKLNTHERSVLKIDEQELLKRLEEIEKWGE